MSWLCSGKESASQCRRHKRWGFHLRVGKVPCSRKWQPTPIFLPGKCHGQRSLAGYSPWGHKESDTTKRLSTHTHHASEHSALNEFTIFFRGKELALCLLTVSIIQRLSGDLILPQGTVTNCSVMETALKVQLYPLIQPPQLHGDTLTFEKCFHFPCLSFALTSQDEIQGDPKT